MNHSERLIQLLTEREVMPKKCGLCRSEKLEGEIAVLPAAPHLFEDPGYFPRKPYGLITCQRCGHTLFFDLKVLGVQPGDWV